MGGVFWQVPFPTEKRISTLLLWRLRGLGFPLGGPHVEPALDDDLHRNSAGSRVWSLGLSTMLISLRFLASCGPRQLHAEEPSTSDAPAIGGRSPLRVWRSAAHHGRWVRSKIPYWRGWTHPSGDGRGDAEPSCNRLKNWRGRPSYPSVKY